MLYVENQDSEGNECVRAKENGIAEAEVHT
jgi:hypothetical protein